ncbi:MAG: T9SS type A sorting domain-containing protein [Paludibacteraceae bacterium]|nr:T9SS type A sorting domain-containing protein [Paludibacteraceae bacterium]
MRKTGLIIILLIWSVSLFAGNTIEIPLEMSTVKFMPTDNPTGSTPDPTDPNQFRVTLTGNMLTVFTQKDQISYVVIRSDFSEKYKEDYFYGLSLDSISCPITQPGKYGIHIGHWDTDFLGILSVYSIHLYDFNGKNYDYLISNPMLPQGMYILRVETNYGYTATKIIKL